jgi:hypothetical protein
MPPAKDSYHFSHLARELISDFRKLPNEEPSRMKKRPTKELAGLMEALRVKYRIGMDAPEYVIRDHWAGITGPLAQYSHAATINQKNWLTVLVSHGVAREELRAHQREILAKIQKLPGCAHVRGINLRAG